MPGILKPPPNKLLGLEALRFLVKSLQTRTLAPFAIYCLLFGLGCAIYLNVK